MVCSYADRKIRHVTDGTDHALQQSEVSDPGWIERRLAPRSEPQKSSNLLMLNLPGGECGATGSHLSRLVFFPLSCLDVVTNS